MTVKFPMKQRRLLKTVAKGGFLSSRLVRWKLLKKLPQSHWQERWVWRLFYIMLLQCILDFHQMQGVSLCTIMPHYVKKLWEKNYWRKLRSIRIIDSIIVTVIFFERWEEGAIEMSNNQLVLNEFIYFSKEILYFSFNFSRYLIRYHFIY